MQRLITFILLLVCVPVSAQVYQRTGPDGKVYFSDTPGPDATPVDVAPAQAVSLPPVGQPQPDEQTDKAVTAYTAFTIVSPGSEADVRSNNGNVMVQLSLQPELSAGHTITLKVDGEDGDKVKAGNQMSVELVNLSRGRHTVAAEVIDAQGKVLIKSESVSFNVLRVAAGG
jgi:hypothetical protein